MTKKKYKKRQRVVYYEFTDEQEKLIDQLADSGLDMTTLFKEEGILKELTKRFAEKALDAEMEYHLGYPPHKKDKTSSNIRNGKAAKKVKTAGGTIAIETPRDRDASFEPQLIKKRESRLRGFDEKVIYLYSTGRSTRDIQEELEHQYGTEVSPALISLVTDAVMDDVRAWQQRRLDEVYPIIYFDALVVKSREEGPLENKSVYLALGVNMEGEKEVLGLWISKNEGAKFWSQVFSEIQYRGVKDCFIACVDGLKGLPEAIEAVFPKTQVQLCIVHKVRSSLKYVSWKERKELAGDLRAIYQSASAKNGQAALEKFRTKWDKSYPLIGQSWDRDWERLSVFYDYPEEIRKVIYTTNAIESLNYQLRKVLKTKGSFPSDESVEKILYLALCRASKKWTLPIRNWGKALNQFAIFFEDRVKLES